MENPFDACRTGGDVEGATMHGEVRQRVLGGAAIAERRVDAPRGVVGRRGDDSHVMAAAGEPEGHLAGVLADAGQFG